MPASSSEQVTIYRPHERFEQGLLGAWILMVRNLIRSRSLIWELFKRDLFANYKKSFLGSLWIVLSPLIGILTWIFFKHTGMLHPGEVGVPYGAYVLMGSLVWGLFMGFYTSGSQTLSAGSGFIMTVHYPHEVFLIEKILIQLFNFSIAFILNLGALMCFGIFPTWSVLWLPLLILPLLFLGAALGLLVALFSVVAIDSGILVTAILSLWMLITPVVYSVDQIHHRSFQLLIQWNPLTYLVASARDIVLYGSLYHPLNFFISALGSLGFFLAVWRLFYLAENKIIERMS